MMTVSETSLLVFSITVSLPSFVTSEQTCVTPSIPCDWPNCPQGDPGWRHEDVKVTINRGEVEDSLTLDWANTVLYPNLVTGIFVDSTYYPRPQNPLKFTVNGPICNRDSFHIRLTYNVRDDRGIDLCYETGAEFDPYLNETFVLDKEVTMKKVELSEDTYRVEWLEGMFRPRRYEKCVVNGYDGQQFMDPSQRVYFTKIPFCSQTELEYSFYKRSTNNRYKMTKVLRADCDKPLAERDNGGGMGSGMGVGMGTIGIIVLGAVIGGVLYAVRQKWIPVSLN